MQEQEPRVEPVDVEVHVDQRLMRVTWSDGHEAVYDFEHLRWQCPCAQCVRQEAQRQPKPYCGWPGTFQRAVAQLTHELLLK